MGIPGKQRKFSLRRTLDVSKPTGSPDIKSGAITGDERIELLCKTLKAAYLLVLSAFRGVEHGGTFSQSLKSKERNLEQRPISLYIPRFKYIFVI